MAVQKKPKKRTRRQVPAVLEPARVYHVLKNAYPEAHCALDYRNPFELLIATILSAQCTDKRVNMVTPGLFRRFPTPAAMASASQDEVEELVRTTGFFRSKAKSLREASSDIQARFGGKVPAQMEDLLTLRGVARKTANVVLGNAYGISEGVVVDTHVSRLAARMGLTREKNPVKIEKDLCAQFPRKHWTMLSHLFIAHGREVCDARKPLCSCCPLADGCPRTGVERSA